MKIAGWTLSEIGGVALVILVLMVLEYFFNDLIVAWWTG